MGKEENCMLTDGKQSFRRWAHFSVYRNQKYNIVHMKHNIINVTSIF